MAAWNALHIGSLVYFIHELVVLCMVSIAFCLENLHFGFIKADNSEYSSYQLQYTVCKKVIPHSVQSFFIVLVDQM